MSRLMFPTTHSFAPRKTDSSSMDGVATQTPGRLPAGRGLWFRAERKRDEAHEDTSSPRRKPCGRLPVWRPKSWRRQPNEPEETECKWPGCGDKAPDIVAEARARAAEARGEQLRKIDCEARK